MVECSSFFILNVDVRTGYKCKSTDRSLILRAGAKKQKLWSRSETGADALQSCVFSAVNQKKSVFKREQYKGLNEGSAEERANITKVSDLS